MKLYFIIKFIFIKNNLLLFSIIKIIKFMYYFEIL
jgi:hypothetical protein